MLSEVFLNLPRIWANTPVNQVFRITNKDNFDHLSGYIVHDGWIIFSLDLVDPR
jgi:hypothetical protein